jgi:hypothetical protein
MHVTTIQLTRIPKVLSVDFIIRQRYCLTLKKSSTIMHRLHAKSNGSLESRLDKAPPVGECTLVYYIILYTPKPDTFIRQL